MKSKWMALLGLAAGVLVAGATPAAAQDFRYRDRDLNRDYARERALQADINRDRARLQEDIRCGRRGAAFRDRHDIERDERAMHAQRRDISRDRHEYSNWR